MIIEINPVTNEDTGESAFEWLALNDKGEVLGGGFCAPKEDAESDAAIWMEGSKGE